MIRNIGFTIYFIVLVVSGMALWGIPSSIAHAQSVQHQLVVQDNDNVVTEEQFWELVTDSQQVLQAAPVRARELEMLIERWEVIEAVRLSNEQLVAIETSLLVDRLAAEETDIDRLLELFEALLVAEQTWPTISWDETASATALAELDRLLTMPELQPPELTQWQQFLSWVNDQLNALDEWLDQFLPDRIRSSDGSQIRNIGLVIGAGAALLLLIIIVLVIRTLAAEVVSNVESDDWRSVDGQLLTADGALNQARTLSDQGDYRTAVRYLYLSTLLTLEERGLLRYDRTLTNREYLRTVAHRPEVVTILQDVVDVFDRVWYGFKPIDAITFQSYARQVEELRRIRS